MEIVETGQLGAAEAPGEAVSSSKLFQTRLSPKRHDALLVWRLRYLTVLIPPAS